MSEAQEITLKVVRPTDGEGLTITNGSTFVIGAVSPPQAKVTVNGVAAEVSDDGAFLAFAPVQPLPKPQTVKLASGKSERVDAVFECLARAGQKQFRRQIFVALPPARKPKEPPIEVFEKPLLYQIKEEQILSRTNWGLLHLPAGGRVAVEARRGSELRLRLIDSQETWLHEAKLSQVREPFPVPVPGMAGRSNRYKVGIPIGSLLPYTVQQQPGSFLVGVTVHYPDSNEPCLVPNPPSPRWGFSTRFEGTSLLINLRRPLDLSIGLRNKTICLDPGHNPDPGAIGPRGLEEREANLKVGLALEKLLTAAGANVVFTHRDEPLPLLERRAAVLKHNPDILVSLHNNSVPDGTDPRTSHGTSTFYYHPQSKPLADAVHAAMLKGLGLPDLKVSQKSLYVCRISECPAILVEPTFIILPEHEKLLMSEAGQQKIARAIFEGIKDFFERR